MHRDDDVSRDTDDPLGRFIGVRNMIVIYGVAIGFVIAVQCLIDFFWFN